MKVKYKGYPNHTIMELISAGVLQSREALEINKVYDVPDELERGLLETGLFEVVKNETKKEDK